MIYRVTHLDLDGVRHMAYWLQGYNAATIACASTSIARWDKVYEVVTCFRCMTTEGKLGGPR